MSNTRLLQPSPSLIIIRLMWCLPPSPGPCWSMHIPQVCYIRSKWCGFFLVVLLDSVFHQRSKELITYETKLSKTESQNFPGTRSCLPLQNYPLKCIPIIHSKLNHIQWLKLKMFNINLIFPFLKRRQMLRNFFICIFLYSLLVYT